MNEAKTAISGIGVASCKTWFSFTFVYIKPSNIVKIIFYIFSKLEVTECFLTFYSYNIIYIITKYAVVFIWINQ